MTTKYQYKKTETGYIASFVRPDGQQDSVLLTPVRKRMDYGPFGSRNYSGYRIVSGSLTLNVEGSRDKAVRKYILSRGWEF